MAVTSHACNIQMAEELKRATKQERNQILKDTGLTLPEEPSSILAMKANVGIPWSKLRGLLFNINTNTNV